jgi:AcrR family transcriptional regulator
MGSGLRDRKKERTRVALESAAIRLFDEHGYDETTVEQIAELADVSTRTFFRYYPTKADVLLRDQVARLSMVESFLAGRPHSEPIMGSLRALMLAITADLPPERHLLEAQCRWSRESDMLLAAIRNHHADVVDRVTTFVAARLETPDPLDGRARVIATACIASLVSVAVEWIEDDPERASSPDVEAAIGALEASIIVPG